MDKYCLKWNKFEENIREYFRKLREDETLFDVTLVTDDGQHVQAHKVILSAGSHFFSDIFLKSNHANMLIYLKGISSPQLENIIDFMYNGEVFIVNEELKVFLEASKEIQVKGLQGDLSDIGGNVHEKPVMDQHDEVENKYSNEEGALEECHKDTLEESVDSPIRLEGTIPKIVAENIQTNVDLDLQVQQMIDKNEGVWNCKVCGKTTIQKQHIKQHAEQHIGGLSLACNICSKIFTNRHNLGCHISKNHSSSFSCDTCEKTGMSRSEFNKHKRRFH